MDEYNRSPVPETESGYEGWEKRTALFLSSQNVSMFGSMLVQYAIIWYVTLTTESGAMLTVSTLVGFLPQIIISLFAGVWADRYPRKFLIIGADALTAGSTLLLAALFLAGYHELWLIFLLSGIRSVGAGIQAPAVNALLPQIVPTERLMKVNSINSTIQPFIMIVTPILAGALLSFSRLEYIFFVDVVTAMVAIGLLLVLNAPPLPRTREEPRRGYLADLAAGLAYIRRNDPIRRLFVFFAFVFFLVTPAAFLSPLLVARSYGDEVWRLTANEIAFFGGSILGGFIMTAWGGFENRFRTIGLSCILWAILFAGLGLAQDFSLYLVIMTLAGLPMPFWSASATTLLQELTDPEVQGRVFGVQQLILSSVMPIGMLVFGPIADVITIEALLVVSGTLMAIPGVWLYFNGHPKAAQEAPAPPDHDMQLSECADC